MTDKILKNLVTEAVSLDREINEKANQLKELKAQLVAEARGREGELARTDGGGTRWTAEGSDGSIAMKYGHVGRAACLGFPTQNTHGYEIAHLGAIENCIAVLCAYCEERGAEPSA